MHNRHDQIAKLVAKEIFEPYGLVQTENEVQALDSQRMDFWFAYDALKAARSIESALVLDPDASYVVLPIRMGGFAAHLEFFCSTCDSDEARDVVRKQLNWHQQRRVVARTAHQSEPRLFPAWIITPDKHEGCFARRRVRPAPDWPPGFYWTDEDTELWFVVLREVPKTRQTLLLRLLGSDEFRFEALAQIHGIHGIPQDDPEKNGLQRFVELLQTAIKDATTISEQERTRFMTEARAEQIRVHEQIERKGLHEGLRESILSFCQALNIEVTASRREHIEKMDLDELRSLRDQLFQRRDWPLN